MAKNKAKLNKFLTGAVTVADPAHSAEVTIPEISELFTLEVTIGAAKIQITVTLKDRVTGEVVEEDGDCSIPSNSWSTRTNNFCITKPTRLVYNSAITILN